jgi:multidrug efflux pump subunit AcrA (membrane-fusion protein)
MLEGMRSANPQGFEKVVGDLIPYIEHLTGQKFGAGDAAPDPVAELRAEIAAQQQQQQEQMLRQAYAQQVNQVAPVFRNAINETLGKQFGAGNEEYFISRIAQIVPEAKMMDALSKGDMKPLQDAMKQVRTDELKRFKTYSDALIKQSKDFRKSVPAARGGTSVSASTDKFDMKTTEGRLAYANAAFNGEI